jgi:hypothetical protein
LREGKVKRFKALLAALLLVVTTSLVVTVSATPAEASGCHVFNTSNYGPDGYGQMAGDWWTWSPTFTVPSTSSCSDIQVKFFDANDCFYYPNSVLVEMQWYTGGQWVFQGHFTVVPCSSGIWKITAYDVLNGTKYRFLTQGYNPFWTDVMD